LWYYLATGEAILSTPNIDERLDRLTERHEALTQTVELMAAEMRDTRHLMDRVVNNVDEMAAAIRQLAGIVTELSKIVGTHETRIQRLEDK